ncbi:MAG: hypothetical protein M1617_05560 [Actinobacteria bacterium]|nr:hypothetical protein [Actinomycetota bacterium]MCL5887748.1 hypothetical protein [Actinomycetota bacterium]
MARRSASNPRYQKGAETGVSRRSAASAKPKRGVGQSAEEAERRRLGRKGRKARAKMRWNPDTPEFKLWRKVWIILLISAMISSGGAFLLREMAPWGTIALVVAYVCLFGAFFVDLTKIRKMRKKWLAEQKAADKSSKSKG